MISIQTMPTTAHTSPKGALSILLVEDSQVLVERLSEVLLSIPGVELAGVADSEADALRILHEDGIDTVLLDLHLRKGTGFGVLRELSKQARRPVVIVFTNYDLTEYRQTAAALGAQYFLDKSRDMDRLPTVIEEIRAKRYE